MRPAGVFDLDGTLIRGTSAERLLVPWLVGQGVIGLPQLAAAGAKALSLPWAGRTEALRRNKLWIRGVAVADVSARMDAFLEGVVGPRWNTPVVERLEALRASGHRIYILSGAPDFIARAVGARLGVDGVVATPMEVRGGRYTGRMAGTHVFSGHKRVALQELARREDLELAASWGFGDHLTDVDFLEGFGNPVAVGGSPALMRLARARGWEVVA